MSPEYITYISPQNAAKYERMVARLGGSVEKRRLTREELRGDIAAEWSIQRERTIQLVDRFAHSDDPKQQLIIDNGVISLIDDAYKSAVKKNTDYQAARQVLIGIFKDFLPEAPPDEISLMPNSRTLTKLPRKTNAIILPKHIELLVETYGLDGIKRHFSEVAKDWGASEVAAKSVLIRTLRRLKHNPQLENLVLGTNPHGFQAIIA